MRGLLNRAITALTPAAMSLALAAAPVMSQTDYYNTDAGRPVQVEDASPVERHAFEAQVAPLRLERGDNGSYHWEVEPELAYGILPGTQVELGIHLDVTDQEEVGRSLRAEGVELAALHNLNVETRTLPAMALAGEIFVPLAGSGEMHVVPSVKAIATRTFRMARVHLNGGYSFAGEDESPAGGAGDHARWMAGAAIDRAFPFTGALLIVDLFVEQPLPAGSELAWTAEAGTRYQLDPFFALDLGVGRRMSGEARAWFITLGAARTFGLRSLIQ